MGNSNYTTCYIVQNIILYIKLIKCNFQKELLTKQFYVTSYSVLGLVLISNWKQLKERFSIKLYSIKERQYHQKYYIKTNKKERNCRIWYLLTHLLFSRPKQQYFSSHFENRNMKATHQNQSVDSTPVEKCSNHKTVKYFLCINKLLNV